MSQYQYYEFQAIDKKLTDEQIKTMRSLSSRAVFSPTHAAYTYHYGDFRGDPIKILKSAAQEIITKSRHALLFESRRSDLNVAAPLLRQWLQAKIVVA